MLFVCLSIKNEGIHFGAAGSTNIKLTKSSAECDATQLFFVFFLESKFALKHLLEAVQLHPSQETKKTTTEKPFSMKTLTKCV